MLKNKNTQYIAESINIKVEKTRKQNNPQWNHENLYIVKNTEQKKASLRTKKKSYGSK